MSLPAVVSEDVFEKVREVGDLMSQGVTSPYALARRTGLKVIEVRSAMDTWHEILRNDADSKDLARDALHMMLERYDKLLVEANENLTNLKGLAYDEKISAQINATIKNIADLDKTRVNLLQQAGLLERDEIGDEVARVEERHEIIIEILKNDLCEVCRDNVRHKVSRLVGEVHGDVIDGDVVDE